ncbi:hypothetical protein [Thiomicrorhabdus sp. Kp2]|uniref:hypothetical protein n=1 Tax=Thiomicrorhabdus sp. Kp2 TaxID=1123518 RepID=UPI00059291C5|nr:hypothetical protein [Thiomicrorhabdus sp. Kp2]
MSMQVGEVIGKNGLVIREYVGEADYKGQKFMLSKSISNSPMIEHPDGRIYSLGWQDVFSLAIDAFNDDDDEQGKNHE